MEQKEETSGSQNWDKTAVFKSWQFSKISIENTMSQADSNYPWVSSLPLQRTLYFCDQLKVRRTDICSLFNREWICVRKNIKSHTGEVVATQQRENLCEKKYKVTHRRSCCNADNFMMPSTIWYIHFPPHIFVCNHKVGSCMIWSCVFFQYHLVRTKLLAWKLSFRWNIVVIGEC